jgi:hypothetical protein
MLEHGTGGAVIPEQGQHDVLGADSIMLQPERDGASILERALRARTQRVWVDPGCGRLLAQSGFASSMSMIGMPSSTG